MKLKQILSEIKLIKPYPKLIKPEDIHNYIYIGGGSEKIKDYIPEVGLMISGFKWEKYISFLPTSNGDNDILIMFPEKYFIDEGRETWFKYDFNITSPPIIKIIK